MTQLGADLSFILPSAKVGSGDQNQNSAQVASLSVSYPDPVYTTFYNFVPTHKTLKMSPAMAAGVSARLWST